MAGMKIDNFSTSDVNLTAIMDTLQGLRQGHFALSLTNMDSSTAPQIAAGSIVDINGSLVHFDSDTSISGTPSDGATYVKLIYSSGAVTAEYTNTAPTFATDKNGWYGTGASTGHRYVAKMIKSGTSYTGKRLYNFSNVMYTYETTNSIGTTPSLVVNEEYSVNISFSSSVEGLVNFTSITSNYYITSVLISSNTVSVIIKNLSGATATIPYNFIITAAII